MLMKQMKNTACIIYLLIFLQHYSYAQKHNGFNNYAQIITVDKIDDQTFQQSLADLKTYLEKITNKPFTIKESGQLPVSGICIKWNSPGIIDDRQYKKLAAGTIEDFVLTGDRNRLLMIGTNAAGLSHAIYTYLDLLGVKWYFPGSAWEYVPHKNDISLSLTRYFSPSFHLRNFFGTGAIVPVPSIDPQSELQKRWNNWKRRNRFGGEINLSGHYGEAFNIKYRKVLEQHPEYLAMINGMRVPWSPSAKLCISNRNLQKLYIEDRVNEGRAGLAKDVNGNGKITVSVEPSDGDGDCECDQCKKMGSVSDRDFFLANEVAKQFQNISPRLFANLYAYNAHASPPSFSLSPQLIVQIIPYAFQRVSSPEDFIAKWQKKTNFLTIYDYYGIPDWHYNVPLSGGWSPGKLIDKLKYWYANHVQGFTLESSYSIGSTGLGLYLASRVGWNIKTDIIKEENDFYKNIFGDAPSIKTFFRKAADDFSGAADIPFLLQQLSKANSESNNKFSVRIGYWQAYMHYVLLFYKMQNADEATKQNKWEDLVRFTWKIYPTAMIHTTRLAELFGDRFGMPPAVTTNWDPHNQQAKKLLRVSFLSNSEIQSIAEKDAKTDPVLKDFAYNIKKPQFILNSIPNRKEKPGDGLMLLEFPETYIQRRLDGTAQFWVKVNETSANNNSQDIKIDLVDTTSGKIIQTKLVHITKDWSKISFPVPDEKTYRINIENTNWIRFYAAPSQWLAFKNIPVHAVMGKLWFYIPAGLSALYYTNTTVAQPIFKTGNGTTLQPHKINDQNLFKLDINPSASVQLLSIESAEYKYLQFYSVPGLFFLYPNYTMKQ